MFHTLEKVWWLVVLFYVGVQGDDSINFQNPVRSASDDEIKNLPGLSDQINFKQYAGYLQADKEEVPTNFHHYWLVESQSNASTDPLVLWLNGGPGCSSLGGLLTELGPFRVNSDGSTLSMNDYSWNKAANVLFMESPTEVGFSYSSKGVRHHDDRSTAQDNYLALKSFFDKFPQYKGRPLYLTGESYAGVYLPTLGVLVDADSDLNLKGIAIGNGYLDEDKLDTTLIMFAYHHGLLGKKSWDQLSIDCCNKKPPTIENCDFDEDTRDIDCDITMPDTISLINFGGYNPYNLYKDCQASNSSNAGLSRDYIDRLMMKQRLASRKRGQPMNLKRALESHNLGSDPPCIDSSIQRQYLNQKSVRLALHVPNQVQNWDICSAIDYDRYLPGLKGGLAPQMKSLIASTRNLTMLVYNGDVDTVCNFYGDELFVDNLGRKVKSTLLPWKVSSQIAGWVKQYDGITFATVRGSGHMVPEDRPKEALHMFKRFLQGREGNVPL